MELNQVEDALVHTCKLEFNYNGSGISKSEIHLFEEKKQLNIMIFVEDGNG